MITSGIDFLYIIKRVLILRVFTVPTFCGRDGPRILAMTVCKMHYLLANPEEVRQEVINTPMN